MPDSQRDYTTASKQYAARIAGYDQRLTVLERLGGGGGSGSGGGGAAFAEVANTPPDPNNPVITPPEGFLWIDTSNTNPYTQYSRGLVGWAQGPAAQTDVSGSQTNVLTCSPVSLIAGRIYEVSGQALGSQQTATGSAQVILADNIGVIMGSGNQRMITAPNLAATFAATGHGFWVFTATTTQNAAFYIAAWTNAGVFRFGPNSCMLTVKDIGGS